MRGADLGEGERAVVRDEDNIKIKDKGVQLAAVLAHKAIRQTIVSC